jgi:pimeloyl-ACP methyl ester carboxylesterase
MAKKIYALLVGINDYWWEGGKLTGCVNDVDHLHGYLTGNYPGADLAVEILKDGDATRDNIIRLFRGHLGKATSEDVALFHYCGHGARWMSAPEFKQFYPDGWDEGLVCYDSRKAGVACPYDLADKELAVLISEVAKKDPHIAVILDCCHSGSGTRDVDSFRNMRVRQTSAVAEQRPLDSYLSGHYTELKQRGGEQWFFIPESRHILLAACERTQTAKETADASGVFTSTLIEVLDKSSGDISYADLFVRCRSAIRKRAENQNPQFESYRNFRPFGGFLGRETASGRPRHHVFFDGQSWKLDAGALHGLPTESEKSVGLVLFQDGDPTHPIGSAATVLVGPQESEVRLPPEVAAGDTAVRYLAEITSVPVAPVLVYYGGDPAIGELLRTALEADKSVNAMLTDLPEGTRYALSVEGGNLLLMQRERNQLIQGVAINPAAPGDGVRLMLSVVKQVVRWEKSWALQNHGTQMDPSLVDFVFVEQLPGGTEHVYSDPSITLDYVKTGDEWTRVVGQFRVRNRTAQTLHVIFAHFTGGFGINVYSNDPIPPGEDFVTLAVGGDPTVAFWVDDPANESVEHLKLIVSTEKVDDFLLSQEELELGRMLSATRGFGAARAIRKYDNDWFTRSMSVRIVRQLDEVGPRGAALANGQIVVQPHPSVQARLSLRSAGATTEPAPAARGATETSSGVAEGSDFYRALGRQGLSMLNFAGARGEDQSILELTDIQNAAALKDHPLEIELKVPLKDDEAILPIVFDGQHAALGGDTFRDESGTTHVSVSHIPDIPDTRRSLGGSLKLYFFKIYLKRDTVNQLRWLEFKPDGSFAYHKEAVAGKVAAAQNILLLVHGIIGDTEGMATGVQQTGLDRKFDLVLAYDYENLSTPIAETAQKLKAQLAAVGLQEDDGRKLTLLVHSMGGLVSRWFIEREGGNKVVDHLVMCGTPNHGSPFGEIDGARKILNVLTGVAVNYVPAFIPFSGAVLLLLNRSKKITPTLEQMNPASDFIKTLNGSDDPGIRYTILAGNVETYQEPSDPFFARMLARAGKSVLFEALFGMQANDIAVSVDSILEVGAKRAVAPARKDVACHHLNYFVSAAGQKALAALEW